MGRSKFDPDEYIEWLERVPVEHREKLAVMFAETNISSYDDVVSFAQKVMTHVLAGHIAPVAADAACKWAEIMLASLAAREAAAMNSGDTYVELIDALTQVQEDEVEASYTTIEGTYAEAVND
jgi:hypothetical protein